MTKAEGLSAQAQRPAAEVAIGLQRATLAVETEAGRARVQVAVRQGEHPSGGDAHRAVGAWVQGLQREIATAHQRQRAAYKAHIALPTVQRLRQGNVPAAAGQVGGAGDGQRARLAQVAATRVDHQVAAHVARTQVGCARAGHGQVAGGQGAQGQHVGVGHLGGTTGEAQGSLEIVGRLGQGDGAGAGVHLGKATDLEGTTLADGAVVAVHVERASHAAGAQADVATTRAGDKQVAHCQAAQRDRIARDGAERPATGVDERSTQHADGACVGARGIGRPHVGPGLQEHVQATGAGRNAAVGREDDVALGHQVQGGTLPAQQRRVRRDGGIHRQNASLRIRGGAVGHHRDVGTVGQSAVEHTHVQHGAVIGGAKGGWRAEEIGVAAAADGEIVRVQQPGAGAALGCAHIHAALRHVEHLGARGFHLPAVAAEAAAPGTDVAVHVGATVRPQDHVTAITVRGGVSPHGSAWRHEGGLCVALGAATVEVPPHQHGAPALGARGIERGATHQAHLMTQHADLSTALMGLRAAGVHLTADQGLAGTAAIDDDAALARPQAAWLHQAIHVQHLARKPGAGLCAHLHTAALGQHVAAELQPGVMALVAHIEEHQAVTFHVHQCTAGGSQADPAGFDLASHRQLRRNQAHRAARRTDVALGQQLARHPLAGRQLVMPPHEGIVG